MEEIKLFKGLASTFQISFISTFRSEISRQFLINLLACFMRGMLKACNFTKGSTLPWMFFTLLKLYKWYQIEQNIFQSNFETSDGGLLSLE